MPKWQNSYSAMHMLLFLHGNKSSKMIFTTGIKSVPHTNVLSSEEILYPPAKRVNANLTSLGI